MTDAGIDPSRFTDDDALVFDDDGAAEPPPPARRRRAPRKGAAGTPEADPAVPPAAATDERVDPTTTNPEPPATAPDAAPVAPDAASVAADAVPPAPAPTRSALRRHALPALVGLSMVTSFASLGGLIAIGRSLAAIRAGQAHASAGPSPDAMAATIARLDRAAAALSAAAARPVPAGPLTADDLRHGLDDLRLALAARQPEGAKAFADQSRNGFSEMATRLDRIEAALRSRGPLPSGR